MSRPEFKVNCKKAYQGYNPPSPDHVRRGYSGPSAASTCIFLPPNSDIPGDYSTVNNDQGTTRQSTKAPIPIQNNKDPKKEYAVIQQQKNNTEQQKNNTEQRPWMCNTQ